MEKSSRDSPPPEFVPTTEPHSTLQDDFVASIYHGVQENLKMKSDEQKLIVEPDTSTGTLSSYKQLDHDFTYVDHDADDNPEGKETSKPTNESEVISMVDVPIVQYESTIPTMTIPIPTTTSSRVTSTVAASTTIPPSTLENLSTQVERALSTAKSANVEILDIKSTLEKHRDVHKDLQKLNLHQVIHHQASRISKLELLNIDSMVRDAVEDQVSDAVKRVMDAPLKARFRDLSTFDMKDLLQQRIFQTDHHKEHEAHQQLYESLERSMKINNEDELEKDLAEERRRKKRKQSIPKPPSEAHPHPPPPPPPSGSAGAPGSSGGASTFQSMQPSHAPQPPSQKGQPDTTTESSHPKSS